MRSDPGGAWIPLPRGPFFRSARLDCALRRLSGVLLRTEGTRRTLAIPYQPGDVFPLPELFCFARPDTVAGRPCLLFSFDRCGTPVL